MISLEKAIWGLIDFHTHSTASDGGDTPTQLVDRAIKSGVSALALTDHNVIDGLSEFKSVCEDRSLFYIPFGVEIYAALPEGLVSPTENDSPDLVILGKNPRNISLLSEYQFILSQYREKIWLPSNIEGLIDLGFKIPPFDLKSQSKDLGIPRVLHDVVTFRDNLTCLIQYILSQDPAIRPEAVASQPVRFMNKYVYAPGKPAYRKRIKDFTVPNAVSLAESMNCKIFIAHPGGEYGNLPPEVMMYNARNGVHGVEVRSYFNTPEQNTTFDNFAKEHRLIRSGGSDCHGNNGPFKIGMHDHPANQVPKEILQELWETLPT